MYNHIQGNINFKKYFYQVTIPIFAHKISPSKTHIFLSMCAIYNVRHGGKIQIHAFGLGANVVSLIKYI